MGTNVSVEGRKILSQVANGTTFEPTDPVHLKPSAKPGIDWHRNDTSTLTNGTATIRNRGGQIAHMNSALSPGEHGPATHPAGGLISGIWNGKNVMISNQSSTTWWEKSAAVMHETITGTAGYLAGVSGMVSQVFDNLEKIIGGLSAEQLQQALQGQTEEMLQYLQSQEGVQDLALSLGLGVLMTVPGVNVVAGTLGGAERVVGIAGTVADAGSGLQSALEGITAPMSPAQIEAAQQKLAGILAALGVEGILKLLGKKSFRKKGASSSHKDNTARPPAQTDQAAPAKAKTDCACAVSPGKKSSAPLPVIIASGEKTLDQTDFTLPGPIPLAWRRRYRSGDPRSDGWFGQGWSHPLSTELWLQADQLQYFDAQGRSVPLPRLQVGQEHFEAYEQVTLARPDLHSWELRFNNGLTHVFKRMAAGQWRLPLQSLRDRNGRRIELRFTLADFGPHFNAFGPPPRPTAVIDSASRTLQLHWSREHQLESVTALPPAGLPGHAPVVLAHYGYGTDPLDPAGHPNLLTHTNPARQSRKFEWKRHLLVGYTLASGQRHRNTYDLPDAQIGPNAKVTLSEAIDDGMANEFQYRGRTTWVRDRLGRVSGYLHDTRQDIVAILDPAGQTTLTPFDANGHPKGSTDPLGRQTSTVFDHRGNLVQIINAAGHQTKIEYNALDLPEQLTDAMGGLWLRQYDARGNLIASTDPLGHTTRYEVDPRGQVSALVDAAGRRKHFQWDHQGQLIAYTDCSGKTSRFDYDPLGYLRASTNALNQTTRYTFDALGRLQQIVLPDQAAHRYQWDGENNLIQYTDPLGQHTHWRYNRNGDPLERIDALGQRVRYQYDAAGQLQTLLNENGARTHFRYDVLGRLSDEVGFDGRHQRYLYNAASELSHVIERGGSHLGPGKVTHFERDALGQLTAKTHEGTALPTLAEQAPWLLPFEQARSLIAQHEQQDQQHQAARSRRAGAAPDPEASANARFSYDKLGRLTQACNAAATVHFAYDPLGQLLQETQQLHWAQGAEGIPPQAPLSFTFQHDYDPLGNRTQTTLPDGQQLQQLFYGAGHLHQINLDGKLVCDVERDDLHREVARSQGQLTTQFAYDTAGRLLAQRVSRQERAASTSPYSGLPPQERARITSYDSARQVLGGLIERHYEYDLAGQLRQSIDRERGLSRFHYDATGRITQSLIGVGRSWGELTQRHGPSSVPMAAHESFAWDAASNPVPVSAGGGSVGGAGPSLPTNRLTVWQDMAFRYDVHGNLITRLQGKRNSPAQTLTTLSWDAAHQLVRAEVVRGSANSEGDTTASTATTTHHYAYDALGRRIAKADAFATTFFAWNGDQLALEQRGSSQTLYLYQPDTFVPLAQVHNGHLHHLHTDHLGTPLEATNDAGHTTWQVTYQTWGNTVQEVFTPEMPQEAAPKLRFQGQYFDAETGLHYNRFRYYDPGPGRFVSQDPIGLAGGLNYFQYAPNPIGWVDPWGLAASGKWTPVGNGRIRIDPPHIENSNQQTHAHCQCNQRKKEIVINQDGTQSHGSRGEISDLTRKEKEFLRNKGFKL